MFQIQLVNGLEIAQCSYACQYSYSDINTTIAQCSYACQYSYSDINTTCHDHMT